jgi:S1-C subfamily serine protease
MSYQPYSEYSYETSTNSTNSTNSTSSTGSTNSNTSTSPTKKNTKTFGQSVSQFFRNIGILTVILLLILSSLFAYVIINQDAPISQYLVNQTPLKNWLSLPTGRNSTGTNINTDTKTDSNKPVNNFLGLTPDQNNDQTVSVIEQVLPSVLSIRVNGDLRSGTTGATAGTGFIVDTNGLVVTNKHVIAQKCQIGTESVKIIGLTQDNKPLELKLMSVDPIYDIAILKIQGTGTFTPVKFQDSARLKLGQEVIAIGNVLGELQNTVTKGIISGLNRSLDSGLTDECTKRPASTDDLIQTDAAINKGNSGGPLFSRDGLLVGMNTYGTEQGQNIGLAISANNISSALQSYNKNNKIIRPRIGIYSRSITGLDKQENNWLPIDYGEIILAPRGKTAVAPGSPAEVAGLKEGDIITEVNGTKLQASTNNPYPLKRLLLSLEANQKVDFTVLKATEKAGDGFKYETNPTKVSVTLGSISFDLPLSN